MYRDYEHKWIRIIVISIHLGSFRLGGQRDIFRGLLKVLMLIINNNELSPLLFLLSFLSLQKTKISFLFLSYCIFLSKGPHINLPLTPKNLSTALDTLFISVLLTYKTPISWTSVQDKETDSKRSLSYVLLYSCYSNVC